MMPQASTATLQSACRVLCPKCGRQLRALTTFRLDGHLLTCTNKVRESGPGTEAQDRTKECGAKIYLLVGAGVVTTALLSPEQFRTLQAKPDCGDPLRVLEWLGLLGVPLAPAA